MTRRPDVFDPQKLAAAFEKQGCPESFVSPAISDFRLFIPLILRELGTEKVFEIVEGAREELGLGPQQQAWKTVAKYIVGWAEEQIEEYKSAKPTKAAV